MRSISTGAVGARQEFRRPFAGRYGGWSVAIVVAMVVTAPLAAQEDPPAELLAFAQSYQSAFNQRDVEAAAGLWAAKAEYVDEEAGIRLSGREEIIDAYRERFKQTDPGTISIEIFSSRAVTDEVLTVDAVVQLTQGMEVSGSRFLATLVRTNDGWQIDNAREIPMVQVEDQHRQLRQLNFLVGQWREETDSHRVLTTVDWSSSRAFLIRSYTAWAGEEVEVEGTQIIGWDPRQKQIRSWSFDSDGGFGEQIWERVNGTWVIQMSMTLPDGMQATATQSMKLLESGQLQVQTTGVAIEGDVQPDAEPTVLNRIEAAPAAPPTNELEPRR